MEGIKSLSAKLCYYFRGQTKTDFAVILLAFAVVVYVGYETIGRAH